LASGQAQLPLEIYRRIFFASSLPQSFLKSIIEIAQIAHGLVIAQGAAGPDVSVGRHVGIGNAGIAGDDLSVLFHDPNGQPVVHQTERIGDALEQDPLFHVISDLGHEKVDRTPVFLWIGRDGVVQVEHLGSLLGNFIAVAVRSQVHDKLGYFFDIVDIPAGDDRSQFHMQVGIVGLKRFQPVEQPHHFLEISLNAADVIVFIANMVQAGFDGQAHMGGIGFQKIDNAAYPFDGQPG
jgi:hypothetical protein